jgi:hypothetical protein
MACLCPACRSWFCEKFTFEGIPCDGKDKTTMPDEVFNIIQEEMCSEHKGPTKAYDSLVIKT